MTDDDGTIESGQPPDPGPLPSFGVAHPAAADPASAPARHPATPAQGPGATAAQSPAATPMHDPAATPVHSPATPAHSPAAPPAHRPPGHSPSAHEPESASLTGATGAGPAVPAPASPEGPAADPAGTAPPDGTTPPLDIDQIASQVYERIGDKMDHGPDTAQDTPPAEQAIMLRDKAPELYDLWLKIAQEKAATSNYVQRAPYEVPERLAQSGRPRALSAMVVVLAFCGYVASLGGPGPYIGGLIAILDLLVMLALFFGLRPDHLTDSGRPRKRRLMWRRSPVPGPSGPAQAARPRRRSPGTRPQWPSPQAPVVLSPPGRTLPGGSAATAGSLPGRTSGSAPPLGLRLASTGLVSLPAIPGHAGGAVLRIAAGVSAGTAPDDVGRA